MNTCPLLRDIHDCYIHQVAFKIFKPKYVCFLHLKKIKRGCNKRPEYFCLHHFVVISQAALLEQHEY